MKADERLETMIVAMCRTMACDPGALLREHHQPYPICRAIMMARMSEEGFSYREIGNAIGKHRTTIIYWVRRIEDTIKNRYAWDKRTLETISQFKAHLGTIKAEDEDEYKESVEISIRAVKLAAEECFGADAATRLIRKLIKTTEYGNKIQENARGCKDSSESTRN